MSCFSCLCFSGKNEVHDQNVESDPGASPDNRKTAPVFPRHEKPLKFPSPLEATNNKEALNIQAQTFVFRELAAATKNFRQETLLGEGGFGRVYKGQLGKLGQTVAVKQLDRNGMQGNKEFMVEVLMLSLLNHPNLVKLIGYCADGDQRLLVYEYMPLGSLEDHLLDFQPENTPLSWCTRLKIAIGAAKGIEYLHDTANPPVIYRNLKSSNILLDYEYNAKLSDFGLAKLGPEGEKTHVPSRVMGTYGYCAPEYHRTGHLTSKSDIYSFGVILLEIITGRRAVDPTRQIHEQNLVAWAEPYFRDPSKFSLLADPLLEGKFSVKSLNQVVAIAALCLQEEASVRPLISDVVTALCFLDLDPDEAAPAQPSPKPDPREMAPILIPPQPAPAPTYDLSPQPALAPDPAKAQVLTVHTARSQSAPVPAHASYELDPATFPAPAQQHDDYRRENSMGGYNSENYTSDSDSDCDILEELEYEARKNEYYEQELKQGPIEIIGHN